MLHKARLLTQHISLRTHTMASLASLPGAVDLALGRALLPNESKFQEACAATNVISSADESVYTSAICTHSGSFHCDEALAIGLLKLLPRWKDAPVIRTRSTPIHNSCSIVVDVGSTHDHSKFLYDHHQKEFNAEYEDITLGAETGFKTKLSSAGLVYKYYGKEILDEIRRQLNKPDEDAALSDKIWKKIYSSFIEHGELKFKKYFVFLCYHKYIYTVNLTYMNLFMDTFFSVFLFFF